MTYTGPKLTRKKVRSDFEYDVHMYMAKLGVKHVYEDTKLEYTLHKTYKPDWRIPDKRGRTKFFIETKGLFDATDRTKLRTIKKLYPDLDLRLVFMANRPLRKGSLTTYTDWAERNGFKWAIGRPPVEWFQ